MLYLIPTYFLSHTGSCGHTRSWSLNPKPPTTLAEFIMKLSFISLTAAAMAAIVGSAIAAPVPHARDLDKVIYDRESGIAVLERDLDGEPADDLFTRQPTIQQHQLDHFVAAHACLGAAIACTETAKEQIQASYNQLTSSERHHFRGKAKEGLLVTQQLLKKAFEHNDHGMSPVKTPYHARVVADTMAANLWKAHAEQEGREAKVAFNHPK